jgi:hypothetical protein
MAWQTLLTKLKVELSHYRPGQDPRIPGGWGSQISRQSTHEGGKVVLHPHEIHLLLTSVRVWIDPKVILLPKGLRQWKIPVTPAGIESAIFQLVAKCLNQLRPCSPPPSLLTKFYVIFLSSPSDCWCNVSRPYHNSNSCSIYQQFVPTSGQHPSFWRHLRPITAHLISVHLIEDAYSKAIWAFTAVHLEVYTTFWPVVQTVKADVDRFVEEEIVMASRRQNCKRHDRQKIWSETHKGTQHRYIPTDKYSLIKCVRRCL